MWTLNYQPPFNYTSLQDVTSSIGIWAHSFISWWQCSRGRQHELELVSSKSDTHTNKWHKQLKWWCLNRSKAMPLNASVQHKHSPEKLAMCVHSSITPFMKLIDSLCNDGRQYLVESNFFSCSVLPAWRLLKTDTTVFWSNSHCK